MREWYRKLIAIRRGHPALSRGSHRTLSADGDLLVFQREEPVSGDAVVVAANRGDAEASARVQRPASWGAAPAADLLGSARLEPGADGLRLTLPPRSVAIVWSGAASR
jgi:alpha-amylase